MELLFHRVYEMADLMASLVDDSFAFDELDWDRPGISRCLGKFTKTSILAHFCFAHIRLHDLRTARKDPETIDVNTLEAALESYAIPFISFDEFMRQQYPDEQEDAYADLEYLHSWMVAQEDIAFGQLWERMTDEVFYLLFGNRGFLLTFNINLAEFRRS